MGRNVARHIDAASVELWGWNVSEQLVMLRQRAAVLPPNSAVIAHRASDEHKAIAVGYRLFRKKPGYARLKSTQLADLKAL
jgi:hypothetical protein